jgi:hypothetical protein
MARKIENDEQYMQAAQFLIDTANKYSDPLGEDAPEKRRDMAIFDRTAELMQQYRRAELAQQFPYLRKIYADLGWIVADVPATAIAQDEQPPHEEEHPAPAPDPEPPQEEQTVDLGDWLDDE